MSRTFIIPASSSLIDEVIKHLKMEDADYSANLVLFPGKRPGHFLRKELGRNIGRSYIPPTVYSVDSAVDFIYTDRLGLVRRQLQAVDAVALLHEIYLNSPGRFGGTSFDTLDAFLPLGLKLFAELEELKMASLHGRKLEEMLANITLGNLRPLSNVYDAFYEKINALNCCTRALKYSVVADFLSEDHLGAFTSIVIAGFFSLTTTERTIFQTLQRMDRAVFLFQQGEGIGKRVEELGLKPKRLSVAPGVAAPRIHFHQAPDSHGQVFGLTGCIQELRGAKDRLDERTAIVLPTSETLLPVYHQSLALFDESEYNISLGYPATRTPVYGFLQSLMNLVSSMYEGKCYAPDYMKFALHPYTKNILFNGRSDVTRVVFHSIEDHVAGEKSRTFFALEELEREASLFTDVEQRVRALGVECSAAEMRRHLSTIHSRTIRKLTGAATIGTLAQHCIEVLMYIDEQSTARQHPLFRPYVETLIESLDGVAGSLLADKPIQDMTRTMGVLKECIAQAQVPFPGTPVNGLQVLGFLETRNLRFDEVFVLDVNEDSLPGTAGAHTIIPQQVRENLGLPTRRQREEIAAYHFDTLVSGAREVHLFFSENARKERSRFVEQLLWERQKGKGSESVRDDIQTVGYNVWLGNALPAPVRKSSAMVDYLRQFTYYATSLDTYLRCPLKFYYRHVLGLKEKEEVAGEIDSGDIGSFVHEVLSRHFRDKIGKRLLPEDLNAAHMNALVDRLFIEWFGEEQTGAKHLLKRQVRSQLARFLAQYQVPLCTREVVTVLEVESRIQRLTKNAFVFGGKLDRVERRGEKTYILDYKTGADEKWIGVDFDKLIVEQRGTWTDAISSLQLAMYAMLYSESRKESIETIVPAYLMLGRNRLDKIEHRLFDDPPVATMQYDRLQSVILGLVQEITDIDVPFAPTENLQEHCPRCPFTTICGTAWVKKPSL